MNTTIDMTADEFFNGLFNLDFLTEEERKTIYDGAELFAKGKVHQASLQTPPTNSERELLAVQSKSLLQLNGKLMEQKARIAELEKEVERLKGIIDEQQKRLDDYNL